MQSRGSSVYLSCGRPPESGAPAAIATPRHSGLMREPCCPGTLGDAWDGPVEPELGLPGYEGFRPATHERGCGSDGRLRILCLHGKHSNAHMMEKQMERFLLPLEVARSWVELEFVDSPHVVPEAAAPEFSHLGRLYGGEPHIWHGGDGINGSSEFDRSLLAESADFLVDHIGENGPFDGLLGFSQGAELLAIISQMAEEGEFDLQEKFKFLVLFSHTWPMEGGWHPRAPLKIPSCQLYETNGNCPPSSYEHLILHWDPSFREVISHDQGHELPELSGDGLTRFQRFLESFHAGKDGWSSQAEEADGGLARFSLPMLRVPPKPPDTPPARRLVATCFHDCRPSSCTMQVFEALSGIIAGDPELCSRLAVDAPDLQRYVDVTNLANAEAPSCPAMQAEHIVSSVAVDAAQEIVNRVLLSDLEQSPVIMIGVGFGAYVALEYALALKQRGGFPWLLFAVQPPVVFPMTSTGCAAGPCDVTCLISDSDTGGERWRFEVSTSGPFHLEVLPDDLETPGAWAEAVASDLRRKVPQQASPAW